MKRALLLQPDLRRLVVDELVDERLQVLGQRDLDRADEIFLAIEIGGRVELVLVDVAEQVLVFVRALLLDLREARIAATAAAASTRAAQASASCITSSEVGMTAPCGWGFRGARSGDRRERPVEERADVAPEPREFLHGRCTSCARPGSARRSRAT